MSEQVEQEQQTSAPEHCADHGRADAARQVVTKYMGWGASAGILPVPVWDVLAIGSVQVLMLKEIFAVYDVEFSEKKARTTVSLLLGSLSPQMLAGVTAATIMKFIPGAATLAALSLPALASASTYAVGKIMIGHLEKGGSLEDFNAKEHKEAFNESVAKGKEVLKSKKAAGGAEPATA